MNYPHQLVCICGKRFRSMGAEAVHRHNFPALCKQNRKGNNAVQKAIENDPFRHISLSELNKLP